MAKAKKKSAAKSGDKKPEKSMKKPSAARSTVRVVRPTGMQARGR